MLGDWVQTPDCVTRVESIGPHSVLCEGIVRWLAQIEIQPVPLTPEILLKNGFDIAFHHAEIRYGLYWDINTKELYTNEGYENATICKIRYVHELQHALRLCGIEKEIEL